MTDGEKMAKLISVIAPMFNEEELVREYCEATLHVLRSIEGYDHEVILVNDGSQDRTYEEMVEVQQDYPDEIGIINETRNFGLEGAIHAGMHLASGDIVVVMDADLQDPPSLMIPMLEKIENGADIVTGSRVSRDNDSVFKRVTAGAFYGLLDRLSGNLKLENNAANYRMMTRKAVDTWLSLPEANNTFRVTIPYVGLTTDHVEYGRDKRAAGETKYHFGTMLRYALSSITGISTEPLRRLIYLVPLVFCLALVAFVAMLVSESYWKAAWLVIAAGGLLSGIVLLPMACIGIYVGEILVEVKRRPQSLVQEYRQSGASKGK